ncbi:hypothetical protein [Streptomyces sp. NPDC001652]|uniref:hypothetical protein n=1 Tax=Streptomyces sp. NPDC001652 TaxID=3154393 RepID=UPI00332C2CDB
MSSGLLSRRSLRGATALRGGRAWRPGPFPVFGFLCWLVMSLAYWAAPLCCEAGLHAAVIERLRVDLWHPRHPLTDLPGAGSPYYSPYAVAQGVFARLTGLGGWEVVRLAGPLNLLVLLTGLGRLVRVLTPRPWAPVLALPVLLTAGDPGSPAAFAVGLSLWAWALTGARARNDGALRYAGPSGLPGIAGYAGAGVLYGAVLLIDPVTAVGAVTGAVAFVAGWQRGWGRAVGVRWAVTAGVAVVVAVGWPYFDLVAPERVPVPWRFWPVLVGLPALWARGRRDPLTVTFVLGCAVAACGYGGIAGVVALVCAAAVELPAPRPWGARRGVYAAVVAAVACLGLLTVPRPVAPPTYEWAARHIGRGEVVLTADRHAALALAGFGANLVPPGPAAKGHEPDVRDYLSPASTRGDRAAVVRRHQVRWLLLTRQDRVPGEAVVVAWSARTGEVLARVAGAVPTPTTTR